MLSVCVFEHNSLIKNFKYIKYNMDDDLETIIKKYDSSYSSEHVSVASRKCLFTDYKIKVQTAQYYGKALSLCNYLIKINVYSKSKCNTITGQFELKVDSRTRLTEIKNRIKSDIDKFLESDTICFVKLKDDERSLDESQSLIRLGFKEGSIINIQFEISNENQKNVFVKIVNEKTFSVKFHPWETIAMLKAKIEDKENIPIQQQGFVFGGRQLENDRTMRDYNINEQSTIHMFLRLRGGGVIFADVERDPFKSKWNFNAPTWRRAGWGLCLEGLCMNSLCKAYRKMVIIIMGLPYIFELGVPGEKSTNCPMCDSYVKPITCGLNNCEWRYMGIKETDRGLKRVECDWKQVSDEYHRFNDDKESLANWSKLLIETKRKREDLVNNQMFFPKKTDFKANSDFYSKHISKTRDEICAICLLDDNQIEQDERLNCQHKFHKGCLSRWIKVKRECPMCRTACN